MPNAGFPLDNGLALIAANIATTLTSTASCLKDAVAALVYASDPEHATSGSGRRTYWEDMRAKDDYVKALDTWHHGLIQAFPGLPAAVQQAYDKAVKSAAESLTYTVTQGDQTIDVVALRRQIERKSTPSGITTFTEALFAIVKGTSKCTPREGAKVGDQYKEFEVWLQGQFSYTMDGAVFANYAIVGTPEGGLISLTCCASG
jgi:hypothetical protein